MRLICCRRAQLSRSLSAMCEIKPAEELTIDYNWPATLTLTLWGGELPWLDHRRQPTGDRRGTEGGPTGAELIAGP